MIQGRQGISAAYATGRRRIVIRGKVHRETIGGREAIVIDEIPYQIVQNNLIERIVEAARADRIPDIADVKNFSGKTHGTRIVVTLKKGADPDVVEKQLYEAAGGEGTTLTRVQAEGIGALRLIQLVGLEIEKLVGEYSRLLEEIDRYERILADEAEIMKIIRADAGETREKFATDRLTVIERTEAEDFDLADLIAEHKVVVTISHQGYVKRLPTETYREQGRGGRGIKGSETKEGDFIRHLFVASTYNDLLCFTNKGRVFKMKVFKIPEMSRTARGRAIVNLLELRADERVVAFLPIEDFEVSEDYLFFATAMGRVKRTALADYRNVHRAGIIAINLNDGDRLIDVVHTHGDNHVLLATASGLAIRFNENDARVMGRSTAGVKGIEVQHGDEVVGVIRVEDDADLLTATANGYGKRTALAEYLVHSHDGKTRSQNRGGKGRIDIRTTERNGPVVAICALREEDGVIFISASGMIVRVPAASISRIGRNTQGVRLVNLKTGDRLNSAARVVEE